MAKMCKILSVKDHNSAKFVEMNDLPTCTSRLVTSCGATSLPSFIQIHARM